MSYFCCLWVPFLPLCSSSKSHLRDLFSVDHKRQGLTARCLISEGEGLNKGEGTANDKWQWKLGLLREYMCVQVCVCVYTRLCPTLPFTEPPIEGLLFPGEQDTEEPSSRIQPSCPLLAVRPWANHVTLLSLSFSLRETGIIIPNSQDFCEDSIKPGLWAK